MYSNPAKPLASGKIRGFSLKEFFLKKGQFAKLAGVSLTTLANWTRQGMPVNPDGTINPWLAAKWKFSRNEEPEDNAAKRKALAEAELKELELQARIGELVRADEVGKVWTGAVARCRSRLLSLPSKAAPRVVGIESLPEVQDFLDSLIREALEELSTSEDFRNDGDDPESIAERDVDVSTAAEIENVGVGG